MVFKPQRPSRSNNFTRELPCRLLYVSGYSKMDPPPPHPPFPHLPSGHRTYSFSSTYLHSPSFLSHPQPATVLLFVVFLGFPVFSSLRQEGFCFCTPSEVVLEASQSWGFSRSCQNTGKFGISEALSPPPSPTRPLFCFVCLTSSRTNLLSLLDIRLPHSLPPPCFPLPVPFSPTRSAAFRLALVLCTFI